MYLPIICCLLVLTSGQSFYRTDIRLPEPGALFPEASIIVDFGKTDKGFIDNWPFMLLRISSNETLLYKNDKYLNNYECREGTCDVLDETTYTYPATWSSGAFDANRILPTLSIGGSVWQMKSSTLHVQKKDIEPTKNINQPYGTIGLGAFGDAVNNFQTQYPIFSIRLFNGTQRGEIIFGKDLTKLDGKKTPLVFSSNLNWEAPTTALTIGTSKEIYKNNITFFFDLSYEYIAVPESFQNALKEFAEKFKMTLEDNLYYFSGNISTLPNFDITFYDGKILSIPSSMYMLKDPVIHPEEYCLRIVPMLDKIVLGQAVMTQYYIVFEAENMAAPTITVYDLADPNDDPTPKTPGLSPAWIIGAIVLLLLASSLAFWCGRKSQANKLDDYLNHTHNEKTSLIA
jgi:hypothetical protein